MNVITVTNLSKIKLGTSDTNTKEYHLKSILPIDGNIVTCPFGSNRSRFQYPEIFTYSLEERVSTNPKYFNYKLTVSRPPKANCPVTANFFWDTGWKINLYISIIPNLTSFYSQKNIKHYLPYNYGNIIVDIHPKYYKNNVFKPNIGIIIPCFGRYEYVKQCLTSLRDTIIENKNNIIVVIIDESLTKEFDLDKVKTNKLIEEFVFDFPTIKIFKNKHGNMFDSFLMGCDLLSPFCDYLMNLDSDTVHKEKWIQVLLKTYDSLQNKSPDKHILLSGFNTVNEGRHKIIETYDDHHLKESVGGCHLLFTTNMYLNLLRHAVISHKWDTNIHKLVRKNNGIIAATNPSVIEHIGIISSGHRNVKNEKADKSIDFHL